MTKSLNIMIFMIMNLSLLMVLINLIPSNYNKFHPISMGLILMIMSMMNSLNLSIFLINSWWSMIMFIIMIGGLMILFLYFTSFINNMITSMKIMFFKNLLFKLMMFILFSLFMIINFQKNFNILIQMSSFNNFNLILMYFYNLNLTYMFCIIYILISLTLTVKMIIKNKFTLRKMN